MELTKIRNLSDEELAHQQKTSAEQLFRLRFQVSMGQNDGVKKLRELRKEIAQIKTVARERELGIHGEMKEAMAAAPATETKSKQAALAEETKSEEAVPAVEKTEKKTRKAKAPAEAAEKKTAKAKGARK
jgi:large subunit ribosomal protein L29